MLINHIDTPINTIEISVPKKAYINIVPRFLKKSFLLKLYALSINITIYLSNIIGGNSRIMKKLTYPFVILFIYLSFFNSVNTPPAINPISVANKDSFRNFSLSFFM